MGAKKTHGYLGVSRALVTSLLRAGSQGKFVKNSSFEGVETSQIDKDFVPPEIVNKIEERGGRVTSFFIVRTDRSIPIHKHDDCGEVYLGGNDGITVIISSDGRKTSLEMSPWLFTIVDIGNSHGLALGGQSKEMIFFGIKFEVD